MPPVILLGPQRPTPNLAEALAQHEVQGPVVAITAGWRHDESELDDLTASVGPVSHLPLYDWFDQVAQHAPDVAARYRERQTRVQRFKELYRLRIRSALATVRELIELLPSDPELVTPQLERATDVVRQIDREVLGSVDEVRHSYHDLAKRFDNPWIRDRRDEAAEFIGSAGAVLLAGGHVAVLRNRLLFFAVEHALERTTAPLFAWGAGSMVLTERIVLYYDDAPDGPAEAEILDHGLGLVSNTVVLPHAGERLRLQDTSRVGALARRFSPGMCLGLENGAWVETHPHGPANHGRAGSAFVLNPQGTSRPLETV